MVAGQHSRESDPRLGAVHRGRHLLQAQNRPLTRVLTRDSIRLTCVVLGTKFMDISNSSTQSSSATKESEVRVCMEWRSAASGVPASPGDLVERAQPPRTPESAGARALPSEGLSQDWPSCKLPRSNAQSLGSATTGRARRIPQALSPAAQTVGSHPDSQPVCTDHGSTHSLPGYF